ncbi:unnamed protein product [Phytomonas sp. Hart1]|nr:unnamed protein product [Phytomonas sp. Hart1]|eukprot:CCW72341.1 unnamed protein product [Phytomonas sp. isolate Hart1]
MKHPLYKFVICNTGYGVKEGACVPCTDNNCDLCSSDANKWTHCSLGFTLSTQGKACLKSHGSPQVFGSLFVEVLSALAVTILS